MSDTIATNLVAAANDIGQLLRRDGYVAEQERWITKPPRDALAEDGFFRLLTAPLLKDVPVRAAPAFEHLRPGATTAGCGRAGAGDVRAARAPITPSSRRTVGPEGVDTLRVVDASIIPALLWAHPKLTGIMPAEHTPDRW